MSASTEQTEIDSLREKIQEISRKVDDGNRGLKKWAGVLALVAAIFAVPTGAIQLYNLVDSLFARPMTSVYRGTSLSISYDPHGKTLEFTFGLSLANDGSKADVISDATAHLEGESSTLPAVDFSNSDFSFFDGNAPVLIPFNVEKDKSRNLVCSISSKLGELSERALKQSGMRQLLVELRGRNNRVYILRFCYRLMDNEISQVFEAEGVQTRRLVKIDCTN